ncbi:MAG: hypothetical protein FJX15_15655 [Alphaproteobacteria bacterium]|nr:hypothetical protein [Alphaproteobacteria bacterium]
MPKTVSRVKIGSQSLAIWRMWAENICSGDIEAARAKPAPPATICMTIASTSSSVRSVVSRIFDSGAKQMLYFSYLLGRGYRLHALWREEIRDVSIVSHGSTVWTAGIFGPLPTGAVSSSCSTKIIRAINDDQT